MDEHDHMGAVEIAQRLGLSRARVFQLIASYEDFPAPAAGLAMGRVWHGEDIERWAAKHPVRRRTGRPPGREAKGKSGSAAATEGG